MTRSTRFSIAWLSPVLALSLFGCSFFKDLNADQCEADSDCKRFGAYVCSSDKVCVASDVAMAGSGGTGDGGSGGSTAGSGGMTVAPECESNADCIASHSGAPYICQSGACVSLTIPGQCPFAIAGTDSEPTSYLTQPGKPIIIGAYVPISVSAPKTHPYTLTYQFALEEFMSGTLGGPGSPHRPIVMVLCQSLEPDLKASVDHLVNTLDVPAILATLPSTDLATAYDLVTATKHKVFLLGPFEADNGLIIQDEGVGLMWHMLGPTSDLIPAYVPLMEKSEAYMRHILGIEKGTDPTPYAGPLKVAVVNTDLSWSKDLAAGLPAAVKVNGYALSAPENAANYQRFQVAAKGIETPDVSAVVNKLGPKGSADIIVSLGGSEFMNAILPKIQAKRKADGELGYGPFYILSPDNAFDSSFTMASYYMPDYMSTSVTFTAGVNYASVQDDRLYKSYLAAIQARFPNVTGLESRENLYDAAYYMFYSLAAASFGSADFDGTQVAAGMTHLINPGGIPANVGPALDGTDMFARVQVTLKQGSDVDLVGTMGPPTFNLGTGARQSEGSVWCVNYKPPDPPSVKFDAMRLSSTDMSMLELPATGDKFCFPIDAPFK